MAQNIIIFIFVLGCISFCLALGIVARTIKQKITSRIKKRKMLDMLFGSFDIIINDNKKYMLHSKKLNEHFLFDPDNGMICQIVKDVSKKIIEVEREARLERDRIRGQIKLIEKNKANKRK